jgi:hypothetical protein
MAPQLRVEDLEGRVACGRKLLELGGHVDLPRGVRDESSLSIGPKQTCGLRAGCNLWEVRGVLQPKFLLPTDQGEGMKGAVKSVFSCGAGCLCAKDDMKQDQKAQEIGYQLRGGLGSGRCSETMC